MNLSDILIILFIINIFLQPTYQNWKQLIESNVIKFLSKEKYTPELNKNSVRERLRKYLLHGYVKILIQRFIYFILA